MLPYIIAYQSTVEECHELLLTLFFLHTDNLSNLNFGWNVNIIALSIIYMTISTALNSKLGIFPSISDYHW